MEWQMFKITNPTTTIQPQEGHDNVICQASKYGYIN
jgi:hypothetical protein